MKADIFSNFKMISEIKSGLLVSKAILSLPSFIYLLIPYLLALKKKTLNSIRSYCFFSVYICIKLCLWQKGKKCYETGMEKGQSSQNI